MNSTLLIIERAAPLLMQGALKTLHIWLTALIIGLIGGTTIGVLRCNRLRSKWLSPILDVTTFIIRGIPFYVQLLIIYFVVPDMLNINLSATAASCVTLGICSMGYVSQIIYAGMNAIPVGQWEAAAALGYQKYQTARYIIMPQMARIVLPPLIGEFDQLLKSTAIVSAIGVLELTGAARNIIARDMHTITIYMTLALIYLFFSSLLALAAALVKQKFSYE
jgi:His/Glu/Gln/Arg/opine family amino acid ABC transporter permease subunit